MILVLSDTHGAMHYYYKMITGIIRRADMILHLGDTVDDAKWLLSRMPASCVLYYVRGNNDFSYEAPIFRRIEYKGKSLYMAHGHTIGAFSIDMDPTYAIKRAGEPVPDAILYGHTHRPVNMMYGKTLILNPGSLGYGRGGNTATVAALDVDENGCLAAEIIPV